MSTTKQLEDIKKYGCEIIPERFYFYPNDYWKTLTSGDKIYCFATDSTLIYHGLSDKDFGPLNLGCIYQFCNQVSANLSAPNLSDKILIYYVKDPSPENIVNSAFLAGTYMIIYGGYRPEEANAILKHPYQPEYLNFTDSSFNSHDYEISLLDCFRAVKRGVDNKFYDPEQFDLFEYLHYEKVESGDMNWIIPNRFMALCSPCDMQNMTKNGVLQTPEFYFPIFKKFQIKTLVRLNSKLYDAKKFQEQGIKHYDLIFQDGSAPPDEIVSDFFNIVDKSPGAVAVHCKAGLGRTGTLIAAYLIRNYNFECNEAIAWLRICRSGSVIGIQQDWLNKKENTLKRLNTNNVFASDLVKPVNAKRVIISREDPTPESYYNLRKSPIPKVTNETPRHEPSVDDTSKEDYTAPTINFPTYNSKSPRDIVDNRGKVIENKDKLVDNKDKFVDNKDKLVDNKEKIADNKNKVIENKIKDDMTPSDYYKYFEAAKNQSANRDIDNMLISAINEVSQGDDLNRRKVIRDANRDKPTENKNPAELPNTSSEPRTDKRKVISGETEPAIGLPSYKTPVLLPFKTRSNENLTTVGTEPNKLAMSMDATELVGSKDNLADNKNRVNDTRYKGVAKKIGKKKTQSASVTDAKTPNPSASNLDDSAISESTVPRPATETRSRSTSLARLRDMFKKKPAE